MKKASQAKFLAILLLLLGCTPALPERPNILLITLDTTRADHMSAYGYFRETTPVLDELAARSIFFENFVAPMATTLPTHTSLFTGTYPLEHGVRANVSHGGQRFTASPSLQSFASVLQESGYRTAAFVSATPLKQGTGIEAGFDHYDQPRTVHRKATKTTNAAFKWARTHHQNGPLFMWVHYFDPHGPFVPPDNFLLTYKAGDGLEEWLDERGFTEVVTRPTGQDVRPLESTNLYDAEIHFMDRQVGVLLRRADHQGWLDNTIVVVMGDHGEGLGQHGFAGHGDIWHEQLHAPFFVYSPWHPRQVISEAVSAADVFPTVLGLAKIPGTEQFLKQATGRDILSERPYPVFSQTSDRQVDYTGSRRVGITVGTWRYLRNGDGSELLFELGADPHEQKNLVWTHPLHLSLMREWTEQTAEALNRRGEELGRGQATSVDEETLRALSELGYVGGKPAPTPDDDEQEE